MENEAKSYVYLGAKNFEIHASCFHNLYFSINLMKTSHIYMYMMVWVSLSLIHNPCTTLKFAVKTKNTFENLLYGKESEQQSIDFACHILSVRMIGGKDEVIRVTL